MASSVANEAARLLAITQTHLSTLQALYQPPYSPKGDPSFCLPWKTKPWSDHRNTQTQRRGRTLCLLTLLCSSLSSACIQMGLFSSEETRQQHKVDETNEQ